MREAARCPYCGSPAPDRSRGGRATGGALDALYDEVRKIREIAEDRESRREHDDDKRRIAELLREVQELRVTLARLRGSTASVRREADLSRLG